MPLECSALWDNRAAAHELGIFQTTIPEGHRCVAPKNRTVEFRHFSTGISPPNGVQLPSQRPEKAAGSKAEGLLGQVNSTHTNLGLGTRARVDTQPKAWRWTQFDHTMTNTSGTIYHEFTSNCILKSLKRAVYICVYIYIKPQDLSPGTLLKGRRHRHPCGLAEVTSADLPSAIHWLKETTSVHGGKLHSHLLGNSPATGSENPNNTWDFLFFIFNSDSEKVLMLQNVKHLILKLTMLNQTNIHFPLLKHSTILCHLIICGTFLWTEKAQQAHQAAPSFLVC